MQITADISKFLKNVPCDLTFIFDRATARLLVTRVSLVYLEFLSERNKNNGQI